MNNELAQAQAQLQQLRESGLLNEAAYQAALAALHAQASPPPKRQVKAKKIRGNVATGDQARQVDTQTYIEHQYNQPQPPDPALPAQTRYLTNLCKRCNILPLGALGGEEETGDEVRLEQVYIELDTQTRVLLTEEEKRARKESAASPLRHPTEDRPLSALEATTQHRRLVLLGNPGSGKSTFVRQLVVRLAQARLQQAELPPGWSTMPLPLFMTLHELAPALAALALDGLSAAEQRRHLVDAMRQQWSALLTEFRAAAFADKLDEALESGDVLLVFDGLDEVAERLRPRVRQAVRAVCQRYPQIQQVIITCRIRSYVSDAVFSEFTPHTLAPFAAEKIQRFIQAWYQAGVVLQRLDQAKANAAAADLQQAVRDQQLQELAENPLLLTTMAIIHQREVGLLRERVRLYTLAVQVLLSRWQMRKGASDAAPFSPQLTALLKDDLTLRRILEQLAYRAHQQQAQGADEAALARGELLTLLEEGAYLGSTALAAEFLDYIDHRAGLLVGRGSSDTKAAGSHPQLYSFPHRTFQEYLAGCQMVQGRSRVREYWERTRERDFWYLAAQLGAEELLYNRGNDAEMLLDLAYDLCLPATPSQEHEWRALLWSGHMAGIVGSATIQRDTVKPDGGPAYLARLLPGLVGILRQSSLKAIERSDAGRLLARLGDPRRAVLDPLCIEFRDIPAGAFLLGRTDPDAPDYEQPQHPYTIPYSYQITRYPVTNAQFQQFVDADGYANPTYWTEAIAHGRWQDGKVQGYIWKRQQETGIERFANAPADYGEPFTLPNHPVVGVNWYEALAFTRWLTEQLHESGALPQDWAIHLPSEAEWEKAARGHDNRIYPWGSTPDPNAANYDAAGINTPSAVGCFPSGASPYDVEELAGNIWEWTLSLWGKDIQKPSFGYPYKPTDGREDLNASDRVLRVIRGGGSWGGGAVGCGARARGNPDRGSPDVGFRLVASPLPLASE